MYKRQVDVTAEARAIMRCVQALRGRFGKTTVVDVLRGAEDVYKRQANAFTEDVQESKRAGADDHLSKPISVKDLAATLGGILGRA